MIYGSQPKLVKIRMSDEKIMEDARHQKWVANFESALGDGHLALEYREGSECMTLVCLLRQELGEVGHFRKRNGSSRSFDSHLIHNR